MAAADATGFTGRFADDVVDYHAANNDAAAGRHCREQDEWRD